MGVSPSIDLPRISEEEREDVLHYDCTLKKIAQYIREGKANRICLMTGAGISVSAGIPDFRTPGTGLYDNLQKYSLPKPEAIFDIQFFREDPTPFYDLARDLLPNNYHPTPMHHFIRLLQDKGLLLRCYTQNIDTLERQAGVKPEYLIEAHGSFGSCFCVSCGAEYDQEYFRAKVVEMTDGVENESGERIPWCKCEAYIRIEEGTEGEKIVQSDSKLRRCNGNVKPNIVFFGEQLPKKYFDMREADMMNTDLLMIAGTSLKVAPFCNTMHYCNPCAPRVLLNKELVGLPRWPQKDQGFEFNLSNNYRDVAFEGSCDEGIWILADLIGWRLELEELIKKDNPQWELPKMRPKDEIDNIVNFNYRNDSYDDDDDDDDEDVRWWKHMKPSSDDGSADGEDGKNDDIDLGQMLARMHPEEINRLIRAQMIQGDPGATIIGKDATGAGSDKYTGGSKVKVCDDNDSSDNDNDDNDNTSDNEYGCDNEEKKEEEINDNRDRFKGDVESMNLHASEQEASYIRNRDAEVDGSNEPPNEKRNTSDDNLKCLQRRTLEALA